MEAPRPVVRLPPYASSFLMTGVTVADFLEHLQHELSSDSAKETEGREGRWTENCLLDLTHLGM